MVDDEHEAEGGDDASGDDVGREDESSEDEGACEATQTSCTSVCALCAWCCARLSGMGDAARAMTGSGAAKTVHRAHFYLLFTLLRA